MKKSIEHLKAIVKDGTRLVSKTRNPVPVQKIEFLLSGAVPQTTTIWAQH